MRFTYTVQMGDFRAASYYGTMMRNRILFRPLIVLLPTAVLYLVGILAELWGYYPLVGYLLIAYAVGVLVVFGGTERAMLRYARSEQSVIGVETTMEWGKDRLHMEIPSRNTELSFRYADIPGVIELRRVYLIYLSGEQTLLLPKAGLGGREKEFCRLLQNEFGGRFEAEPESRRKKR